MKKFSDAFNGLKIALGHKAVVVQVVLAIMAIIGGIIIKLDHYEWLAFIICIVLVIFAEIFNTAIEKIGNFLTTEQNEKIKVIKDLSSGAVLVAAIGALVVCVLCTIRRLF